MGLSEDRMANYWLSILDKLKWRYEICVFSDKESHASALPTIEENTKQCSILSRQGEAGIVPVSAVAIFFELEASGWVACRSQACLRRRLDLQSRIL